MKKVSYLLVDIPLTEAGVRELLQRSGSPKPVDVSQECKSGTGFTTIVGPVLIPLGEQISPIAMALSKGAPAFPIREAEEKPAPLPRLILSSPLPMPVAHVENWVEETVEEIQDVGIPTVMPAKRRIVLSVASSTEVRIHGYTEGDSAAKRDHRWTLV